MQNAEKEILPVSENKPEKVVDGESFLDEDRESAYDNLTELLRSYSDNNYLELKKYLVSLSKLYNPQSKLIPLDLDGVELIMANCDNASLVAGEEIERPIILFRDLSSFKKLAHAMNQAANGMTVSLTEGKYKGSALVICPPFKNFINHEIMHSIDPNLDKREGVNRIITEVLAFYNQCILEGFNGWNIIEKEEERWKQISFELKSYYYEYQEILSEEEYKAIVSKIVARLKELRAGSGDIETQRIIAKSLTIDDLIKGDTMPNYNERIMPDSGVGVGSGETPEQRAVRLGGQNNSEVVDPENPESEVGEPDNDQAESSGQEGEVAEELISGYEQKVSDLNQLLDEYLTQDARLVLSEGRLDSSTSDCVESARGYIHSARDLISDQLRYMKEAAASPDFDSSTVESRIAEHASIIKETLQRLSREFGNYADIAPQSTFANRAEEINQLAHNLEIN